jgi:putative two-component system response regulator
MQKLVFIVDDNDFNLTVAALALDDNYKVLTMSGAEKMFSLLEKKRADLILLDALMPGISGLEAIHRLKSSPEFKDIPVIFLTGLDDDEIEVFTDKALKLGAVDILIKPYDPEKLLEIVTKCIGD